MKANIAVITFDGPIYPDYDKNSQYQWFLKTLDKLPEKDNPPKALVLRVNSPGGTVAATQELFEAVRWVQMNGIKVVGLMEDVAASGGLYLALAADVLIAHAGTLTGSIGVIMEGSEYSQIFDFLGIKTNTIKSGDHKDIFSSSRPMTDEEKKLLHEMIMSDYEVFVNVVAQERRMKVEKVKKFADGRLLSGVQAQKLKLVDGLGGFRTAVATAAKLAKIPEKKIKVKILRQKFGSGCCGIWEKVGDRVKALIPNAKFSGSPLYMLPKFNK